MKRSPKNKEKLDVHLHLTMPLSGIIRQDAEKEQRTFPQLIRFILTKHYNNQHKE